MRMTKKSVSHWSVIAALLGLFLLPGICLGATDLFLKLDGIPGESVDRVHAGEIDIQAYSWAVSNSGAMTMSTGVTRTAGRVDMKALTLTKFVDLASPGLFLWCCNGKHIKLAELTVRRAGTTPVEYLKIILEDVVVGGISTGVSRADDRPTEEVVLYFGKVRYEYVPVRPDGKAGGRVNVGWSLEENRAL